MTHRRVAKVATLTAAGAAYMARRRIWRSVTLTDLLGRRGGPYSVARAAAPGVGVVGTAAGRAFLFRDGHLSWLTPVGCPGDAHAVTATGVIAGSVFTEGVGRRAFVLHKGAMRQLPPLPGAAESIAYALAADDDAVGISTDAETGPERACRWQDGAAVDLGTLGGVASAAFGAAHDATVGWAETAEGHRVAAAWQGTSATALEPLGGTGSVARAVNRRGLTVGAAENAQGSMTACVWDPSISPLDGLGGGRSEALAVDDAGVVAGYAQTREGHVHAVVWRGTRPIDLGTLGGVTSVARGLDGAGKVVGEASTGAGPVGLPWRPGGWSWEDHAFVGDIPD